MEKRKGNPIGWCTDTWNPIVGCSKCSSGCLHCYAERMAIRLAGMGQEKYRRVISNFPNGEKVWKGNCYFLETELEKPFHWKKSRVIFVCSMGDLFHENVPFKWVDRVMEVIAMNPQHKFMILTKRPEKMAKYFSLFRDALSGVDNIAKEYDFTMKYREESSDEPGNEDPLVDSDKWPLPNLALGATAENQEMADRRIPILLQIPAAVRFVSIEPMLGPVDLLKIEVPEKYCVLNNHGYIDYYFNSLTMDDENNYHQPPAKLDWVIAGGENGPGARPMSPDWIYGVRDACLSADIPFYFKGWGLWKRWPFTQEHKGKKYITIDGYKMVSSKLHIDYLTFKDKGDAYQYKQRPAGW